MRKKVRFCVLIILFIFTSCSDAPLFVDRDITRYVAEVDWVDISYTLEELSAEAAYIVEADVADVCCDEAGYAIATLHVRRSIKGELVGDISVRDTAWPYSPQSDVSATTAERSWQGDPMMRKGHRVVLFLEEPSSALVDGQMVYRPVQGLAAAKFFLDADNAYHNALLYSELYSEQAAQTGNPLIPDLTDMTPKTFDELCLLVD